MSCSSEKYQTLNIRQRNEHVTSEELSQVWPLSSAPLALTLIHIYILVIAQDSYAKRLIISATQLGEQL